MAGRRVLVIGASGDQGRGVAEALAAGEPELGLVLAARDERRLRERTGSLGEIRPLDLHDERALGEAVGEADLVVNAAGPFHRTAEPVARACLDAGVDYLDLGDDPESVRAGLALHEQALDRGVALYMCCGASPGLYNVMARELAGRFDRLVALDFAWAVGDEGKRRPGADGLAHLLHVTGRSCVRWEDGEARDVEPVAASSEFPLHGLGDYRLYEVGHPEPITVPLAFPELRLVRCFGGFHPEPLNGMVAGLGRAVAAGGIELDAAVRFMQSVADEGLGSISGWRYALDGARRMHPPAALARLAVDGLRRHHPDFTGGLAVRAVGERDGETVALVRRTAPWGPHTFWTSFDRLTGRCAAAFVALALDGEPRRGALFPEAWVEPDALYDALARHGAPREAIVDGEDVTVPVPPELRGLAAAAAA